MTDIEDKAAGSTLSDSEVVICEQDSSQVDAVVIEENKSSNQIEGEKDRKSKKQRRIAAILTSSTALVVVVTLVMGITLSSNGVAGETIAEETNTPQSSNSSRNSSTRTNTTGDKEKVNAEKEHAEAGTEESTGDALSNTNNQEPIGDESSTSYGSAGSDVGTSLGNSSSGNNNSSSTESTANNPVWVPGWDEQIWVDTSSYQSVFVGENPTYVNTTVCNDCGATNVSGEHLLNTGHSGYVSKNVQVGSTPVYENQWVESGYYETVHHDGYWK